MSSQLHFKTAFWSQKQPELTLPDFYSGFNVLHQKLGQNRVENEELITFFKERISFEENYANKLLDQGKAALKSSGFGRDEGASLLKCFNNLKETSQKFGEQHKSTALALSRQVLVPLQEFHDEYKRNVTHSRQAIESMLKQFDGLTKEAEKARTYYHRKCREADKAEILANEKEAAAAAAATPTPTPTTTVKQSPEKVIETDAATSPSLKGHNIQLGNQVMTKQEFDILVRKMKKEIAMGDHRVPILGTYKNTSTGEDIAIWLQQHLPQCKDSPGMADIVGQQLLQPYNILRLIGQRGNKFISSSTSFYQWRTTSEENETASISSDSTYNAFGGLLDKISSQSGGRREAEKADEVYRQAVVKLDQVRMAIEQAMFAHLSEMEQVELNRIEKLKQIISAFIATLSVSIPQDKLVIEEMVAFQDALKPDQDIQDIIKQYAVSSFSPKAIVYDNFYHGVSKDQVFGVLLEDLSKQEEDQVPKFVSTLLQTMDTKLDITQESCWCTPIALDKVHSTCSELNISSDNINAALFEKYEPDLLVAVLRYFLLELPECLLTYEFYDSVETLLGEKSADQKEDSLHLTPFSNLIATLPGPHFATLKLLFAHIIKFTKKVNATPETVQNICQSLGPVILRSRVESYSTLTNTLPSRFVNELLQHYDDIFSESTNKLHLESEKRRLAKPIVAQQSQPQESATPVKRANSLMGFTISTADKWIFQRNNSQSPTEVKMTPTVPLSFGSLVTSQESPPASPSATIKSEAVMFDGGDLFDQEDNPDEKKKGTERPANEHMDSSFFDDDDDE